MLPPVAPVVKLHPRNEKTRSLVLSQVSLLLWICLEYYLVPEAGLEPVHPYEREILIPLRRSLAFHEGAQEAVRGRSQIWY